MPKHTAFEAAVSRMERLTDHEKIALMKLISAQLGGPRFYTVEEVQASQVEAIKEFCKEMDRRNTIQIIDPRRVN